MVELILSIPIPVFQKEDCWAWTASNFGLFSVKFAYWLSRVESPPSNIDAVKGHIWKRKIHERFKMFLWRIAANLLPSKEIISRLMRVWIYVALSAVQQWRQPCIYSRFVPYLNLCGTKDNGDWKRKFWILNPLQSLSIFFYLQILWVICFLAKERTFWYLVPSSVMLFGSRETFPYLRTWT